MIKKTEYVRFMCSAVRNAFIFNKEVLNVFKLMFTSLKIIKDRVIKESINKFELILTSLSKINEDDINDLKVRMIEIELIFFLFVKITDYNKVIAETSAATLKLVADYFKIFLIKLYINEDDITLNKLRADFNSFNITDKIYVNSL